MSERIIQADRLRYTLGMEDAVPPAQRFRVAVRARVIDELTGETPRVPIRLTTPTPGLAPRVGSGGLIGLIGVPFETFPALDAQPYATTFEVRADRYVTRKVAVDVPQDAQFPDRFIPADLGDLALHRESVLIAGRVTERLGGVGGIITPVPGANLDVTEVWPTLPPADGSVPPEAPDLVSLVPPLHFARTTAAGRLRRREMTPVPGQDKELLEPAEAGTDRIRISDWIGLAVGDVLLLDTDPAIQEYVTIGVIDPVGADAFPATITLTHPLAYRHRSGIRVQEQTPQAPGPDRQFRRDAIPGDACVFLNGLGGLPGVQIAEVLGGVPPSEFHALGLFSAVTDAEGEFRLPPLSRVAQLTIAATEGGRLTEVTVVPNYNRRENRLEIGL